MRSIVAAIGLAVTVSSAAAGQGIARVAIGFGVDSTTAAWSDQSWHREVLPIFRAWSEYLAAGPRESRRGDPLVSRGTPDLAGV